MTEKKKFLTDIDNCVLSWSSHLKEYLILNHPELEINENLDPFKLYPNILDAHWEKFNETKDFEELTPLRDAQEYIKKICDLGYSFVGISSCLPNSNMKTYYEVRKKRLKNLEMLFPGCFEDCI